MRARRVIACLALLAAAMGTVSAGAAARPAARLLVYAQEWSLWPSRSWVPAGTVVVELWNRGQDPHDVRIQRVNGRGQMVGRAQGVRVTLSEQISRATWHLSRGRYELYCSMPGHMKKGMHARLTVR